jgi:uncharacterized membrane protein YgaE (UPF0421/DUF939 family)
MEFPIQQPSMAAITAAVTIQETETQECRRVVIRIQVAALLPELLNQHR